MNNICRTKILVSATALFYLVNPIRAEYDGIDGMKVHIYQDPKKPASTIRLSVGGQMALAGLGIGEVVLQSYDFIPAVFLEERLKGTIPGTGLDKAFMTYYETETKFGINSHNLGKRSVSFEDGGKGYSVPIDAHYTWIPYLGLQTIYIREPRPDSTSKKDSATHTVFEPGYSFAFALGFHRDISTPWTQIGDFGNSWSYSRSMDVGIKYYTLRMFNRDKKKYDPGYPTFFWSGDWYWTPVLLGIGAEVTYANEDKTLYLVHMHVGVNFKN